MSPFRLHAAQAVGAYLGKRCLAACLAQHIEKVRNGCLQVRPVPKIHLVPSRDICIIGTQAARLVQILRDQLRRLHLPNVKKKQPWKLGAALTVSSHSLVRFLKPLMSGRMVL